MVEVIYRRLVTAGVRDVILTNAPSSAFILL